MCTVLAYVRFFFVFETFENPSWIFTFDLDSMIILYSFDCNLHELWENYLQRNVYKNCKFIMDVWLQLNFVQRLGGFDNK